MSAPADSAGDCGFILRLTPMHPDRKIGIAMGILLIGVVGALFFRNEPLPESRSLSREREEELNQRLRDRDVSVYLAAGSPVEEEDEQPVWTLEEALNQKPRRQQSQPIAASIDSTDAAQTPGTELEFRPPTQPSESTAPIDALDGTTVGAGRTDIASGQLEKAAQKDRTDQQFEEYQIQFGDTLSGISQKFLGTSSRYTDIYKANQDRIDNPDRLRVGTAIRIPRVIR